MKIRLYGVRNVILINITWIKNDCMGLKVCVMKRRRTICCVCPWSHLHLSGPWTCGYLASVKSWLTQFTLLRFPQVSQVTHVSTNSYVRWVLTDLDRDQTQGCRFIVRHSIPFTTKIKVTPQKRKGIFFLIACMMNKWKFLITFHSASTVTSSTCQCKQSILIAQRSQCHSLMQCRWLAGQAVSLDPATSVASVTTPLALMEALKFQDKMGKIDNEFLCYHVILYIKLDYHQHNFFHCDQSVNAGHCGWRLSVVW